MKKTEPSGRLRRLGMTLIDLNLFETNTENFVQILIEKWSTRLYLLIILICMTGLVVQNAIRIETKIVTVNNPTFKLYNELVIRYPDLNCPCSQITAPFGSFTLISPSYHPICSSGFVSKTWIETLVDNMTSLRFPGDFRATASTKFQILRELCSYSETVLENSIASFSRRDFISGTLLSEYRWSVEVDALVNAFLSNTLKSAKHRISFFRSFMVYSLLASGIQTSVSLVVGVEDGYGRIHSERNYFPPYFNDYYCTCDDGDLCYAPSSFYDLGLFDNEQAILEQAGSTLPFFRVNHWFTACWAYQALLKSSVNSSFLSNQTVLNELISHLGLPSQSILSIDANQGSGTFDDLLKKLFISDNLIVSNYSSYYEECRPASCFYSVKRSSTFLYIFTSLIALYGGLSVALRFITPYIVGFVIRRFVHRSQNNLNTELTNNQQPAAVSKWKYLWNIVVKINLFKSTVRQEQSDIEQQRWTSRLYILLLVVGVTIIAFYVVLSTQKKVITVKQPSLETLLDLQRQKEFNSSLQCPCTDISSKYEDLMSIRPVYHQVFSSDFVTYSRWLYHVRALLSVNNDLILQKLDFRRSFQMFHLLADLVHLINDTIFSSLEEFNRFEFVSNYILSADVFEIQMNSLSKKFQEETVNTFLNFFRLVRNMTFINQYLNDANVASYIYTDDTAVFAINGFSGGSGNSSYSCSCATDISCKAQYGLYNREYIDTPYSLVPGLFRACFGLESLLQSTFECLYDGNCILNVTGFYQQDWVPTDFVPLNASLPSRFQPNSLVSTILAEIFIEYWDYATYYETYFHNCQPESCSYEIIRRNNLFESITIVLGLVGGLSVTLRIFTPWIVSFYVALFQKGQQLLTNSRSRSFLTRLIMFMQRSKTRLRQLNLFENEKRTTSADIQRQRRMTHVYLVIFSIALSVLVIYNALNYVTESFTISQPSFDQYVELRKAYGSTALNCPCAQVSITFSSFIDYQCNFHPVCSSEFVSEAFLDQLYQVYRRLRAGDASRNAYTLRGTAFSHFQALQILCDLVKDAVKIARQNYLSSSILFPKMIDDQVFHQQIDSSLSRFQETLSEEFLTSLQLARGLFQANGFISLYSTNWQPLLNEFYYYAKVFARPQTYGNCNCLSSSLCTQPSNPSLPGYLVGCTPFEALLQSSIACFYDQQCLELMKTYLSSSLILPTPLDINATRFSLNETVNSIVRELFIEKCSSAVDYRRFFDECHAFSCTVTITKRNSLVAIVSIIFGLYGGLTTSLNLIVPLLVFSVHKILHRRQQSVRIDVKPRSTSEIPDQ